MAKKDKNSLLNIYYSRTMTSDNLSKAANYVGKHVLKGLGAFGKIMTAPFVQQGPTSATIYKSKKQLAKERTIENKSEELLGKAMTWVSPLNYGAAVWNGHGLNAKKGEEEVASWSPAWQAVGRLGELYVGPKAVKGVKATPRAVVNTAAKAGVKPAKAAVVAREINKGIKQNTNNGRIEVTGNYFNSPDKWYRITETPEKYGIMELGKNVTTHDAPLTQGTINGWRSSVLNAKVTKGTEGFIKKPPKIELNVRRKNGQAHGNTSQAAKGKLWGGTTSGSRLFPEGVIEGQAPSMINYGIDRTNFVMTPWELVPNGGRVGFHTGEMPMSNLGWFQKTNKGTYTYEPIIPEKRISYQPKLLLDSPTSLAFFERNPSKLSEAEKAGVPKGERNQPLNTGYRGEIQKIIGLNNIATMGENSFYLRRHGILYLGDTYEKPTGELYTVESPFGSLLKERSRTIKSFSSEDEYLPGRYEVNKEGLRDLRRSLHINLFPKKLPQEVYDYLEQIKTIIPNKAFLNQTDKLIPISPTQTVSSSQITPFIVKQWRGKMEKLGYHTDDISDYQIAQLLTDLYNTLTKLMTGKTKGSIFWHGTPEGYRDFFDFKHTGENTGNMGAMGPGNYFSTGYSYYGDYAEPFLINNITLTPFGDAIAVEKGLIPEFVSPGTLSFAKQVAEYLKNPNLTGYSELTKSYTDYIRKLLKNTPTEKTRMWIGNGGNRPELTTEGFIPREVMIRRNTGIKSLFPHPDLFVKDSSGKVILNRNWNDIRVNYKQGGKMNILQFLKNGSGIHIKKKNCGKFTDYCGGKVTSECIAKGKKSPNAAIRKRATFAANARKWKHKDGGKAFVSGVSILDSNPNAYKYVKKKYKMAQEGAKLNFWLKAGNFLNGGLGQTLMNGITGVIKTTVENKNMDAQAKAAQALNEADWALMMNLIIKQNLEENNRNYMLWVSAYLNGLIQDLPSLIVAAHMGLEKLNQDLAAGKQNLKNKNSQISSAAQAAKSENWTNTFGNIVQQGMGTIGLLIGNNTNSGTTNSKTNFGTSDYKLQLPEIWTNPTLFNKK